MWPPLERWAGLMFEQGILGILHLFASNSCGVGTLPGSMGFMITQMPKEHLCQQQPGQAKRFPPVHIHAMGQGNAKTYLSRLDYVTKWCTLQQSMEGANANFWPTEAHGTDRIIASAAVTVQVMTKERAPIAPGRQFHWVKCMPLIHPSITLYLECRALTGTRMDVPGEERPPRDKQPVDTTPDGARPGLSHSQ